jgi:hypothetical protein
MPATYDINADLLAALRSGGFAGEMRFAVNPNTVVFQATVNQTITGSSFIEFAWDGLLAGDYQDVVAGMTFFITATDDPIELRSPLLRGRVSRDPTGSAFYCNESAINLTDGMIVTVIALFEVLQRDRIGDLVDGYQAFEDLLPLVKAMQSFYYGESDTEFQFSFAPIGQAMAEGATIASYHWTLPSGTVYDTGDADTQNISATIPDGHHWCFLDVTDSGDRVFRFIFEILVCLRDDPAYMFTAHDNVDINGGVELGWNVTTTFFAGVSSLLNRTRCAIVAFDLPKVGDPDLFNNVMFVGYIVQEDTGITGDAQSSTLAQTRFELQSFAAIAGQLPVPSLPVRNDATPDAWGDIHLPTPQRTIAYLLTRYSTLASLCAIDMLYTDSTWFAGEMDLEEGTLLDSVNRIGEEIQARLVFWPQGDATFEINANFLSDDERDALPTLIASGNLEPQDLFGYSLPVPYYKTVGQVRAGCATFYADGSTPFKLDALAPATARQEGNEKPVVLAQLLQADLSQAAAETAAKQRIGDLLEYLNPPTNIPTTFKDGWRILTPSTRVWLTYDLPATDSTRGLPVEPTERWLLQTVALKWNVDNGYWDVSGTVRKETQGGLAQTSATISPNTIDTSLPVLPGLSDYDAFPPDGSLNYTSTDPLDADLQPFDPFDLSQYEPMTTEDAANVADNTPSGNCIPIVPSVTFRSNVTRSTPKATVPGQRYTIMAKGVGQINQGSESCVNLTISDGGWEASDAGGNPNPNFGFWDSGSGLAPHSPDKAFYFIRAGTAGVSADSVTFTFNEAVTDFRFGRQGGAAVDYSGAATTTVTFDATTDPGFFPFDLSLASYITTSTNLAVTTTFRVTEFCYDAGGAIEPLYADPRYIFNRDEDGKPTNVALNPNGGLLVNGLPIEGLVYNDNNEYTFEYIGDGNPIPFVFYDTSYGDNQNVPLPIRVCGPNMGS